VTADHAQQEYHCGAGAGLNISSFLLLGRTSALTMNVCGVIKDWILIGLSMAIFHSSVTNVNLIGYSIAFLGVTWYNYQKVQDTKAAATERISHSSDNAPLLCESKSLPDK
jgi:Triose-phosphate Transporter family